MTTLEAFFNALCLASEHGCITTTNTEDRPEIDGGWKSLSTTFLELTDQLNRLNIVYRSANANPALKAVLPPPLILIYAQRDESVFELEDDGWETLLEYLDMPPVADITDQTIAQVRDKINQNSELFKIYDIKEAQFEGYMVLCLDI